MKATVDPRQILLNLLELKRVVTQKKEFPKNRFYHVLMNLQSGALYFSERMHELEQKLEEEKGQWQIVRLIVHEEEGKAVFLLLDQENRKIESPHLTEMAKKVVGLTVAYLNQKSKGVQKFKNPVEKIILEDIAPLRLIPEELYSHPAWVGEVSRKEVEFLLRHKKEGTYLLHHPDALIKATRVLFFEQESDVSFYILSVSEGKGKISEHIVVKNRRGWFLYNDDPDLHHYSLFPNLVKLLSSMPELLYPFTENLS